MMFSCARVSKVKVPHTRKPKTLTEQHKADLRARRKAEASQQHQSQRQAISSTESLSSEVDDTATGFYVYKQVDQSRRVSVTVHSSRPPQRAKSLEACRPPPLVLAAA